ncbi:2-hydroxycarboxylate transporter family protein [Sutterella wadsworthensis]|uniref:2-hydroxycarboxylate transporter family protein n=1 Tax=Sutterella wadsworthensis TaxID=40545 RepID=UPI003966FBDB
METTSKTFWQTACELKIGPVPAPVYLVLAVIVAAATIFGQLPADMVGGIAIMMVMGILLGDIGLKVPILKDIGGPAILSIFIPSAMVYYGLLNSDAIKAITAFTKGANFLYFYISCLVVGSILGMVRTVLVQGFLRMFVPLVVGTVVASILGCIAGMLCGEDLYHTFFFIVIPILSGGVGEGILPLAAAYSEILNQSADQFLVHFVPAAMLGNLFAITNAKAEEAPLDVKMMGAGLVLACCFFCAAKVLALWIPIPAPILMIILAALIKVLNIMPTVMEQGAKQWYKFVSGNLTWALLVGVGVIYTPWNDVLAAITPAYIFTIMATIFGMVVSGLLCARFMNMYPIESAIVTCCHSGLGGTGDVAILSAANRMGLMPFAQISTRLGGACTVIAATILMRALQ